MAMWYIEAVGAGSWEVAAESTGCTAAAILQEEARGSLMLPLGTRWTFGRGLGLSKRTTGDAEEMAARAERSINDDRMTVIEEGR